MKKIIAIFSFLMILSPAVISQDLRFGLRGGLNLSSFVGEDADDANMKLGVHVGPFARVGINDMLFFQPELLLSTKGYTDKGEAFGTNYKFRQNLMYLDVPLMVGVTPIENFGFLLGLQPSFLLGGKWKLNVDEENNWIQDDDDKNKEDFANVDLALVLGLQYQLENGLDFGFRFNYGFPNVYEDEDPEAHNLNLMFTVGYSIGR